MTYTFAQPFWFLLALIWPLGYWLFQNRKGPKTVFRLPTASALQGAAGGRVWVRQHLPWLRHIALALLMVAMARPQKQWEEQKVDTDGIDIMLALDISPSMLSRDFQPDRLTVAKKVAIDFVRKRPNDRIGLVVFSRESFTHCPLTPDKRVIEQFIADVQVGVLDDGTAIGIGLATALNRLKKSNAKSKIVVLLTDGENNVHTIEPEEATAIAAEMKVKVYTVGIGREGWVESPVTRFPDGSYAFDTRMSVIDTRLLEQMAATTGGRFYRAYSPKDLAAIYDEIDRLEKSKTEITSFKRFTDYFWWFACIAFFLLLLEVVLRWGVLRSVTPD